MATAITDDEAEEILGHAKLPFLRRVRIEGYKSIAFCDVVLHPLTILVGRNASGKSNFLDALAFLRDTVLYGVNEACKRHGGHAAIPCRVGKGDRSLRIEIVCGTTIPGDPPSWNCTYQIRIHFSIQGYARIAHEEFRIEQGDWWEGFLNTGDQVTSFDKDGERPIHHWRSKDLPFLKYYPTDSLPQTLEGIDSISTYNFQVETIRAAQRPHEGVMLESDGSNLASVIATLKTNEPDTFLRVRDYFRLIAEDVEDFNVIRSEPFETVRFQVRTDDLNLPLEFDAGSMSEGSLRALATLCAAFQAPFPFPGGPSLVGIEEPETALHPEAMHAIVDALDEATARTQIILTTHSAELLAGRDVKPGQVLVVRKRAGTTHITPIDGASWQIIQRELSSLADLHRDDKLDLNEDDLERQEQLRLSTREI